MLVPTSAGGLLVTEGIIRPVVSVSITGSIHLLGWTISHRGYHPSTSHCFGTNIVYKIYLVLEFTVTK
jgi:hypothetical protein